MFKAKNKEKAGADKNGILQQVSSTKETGSTCVISSGTRIEGKFHATEDVRLDGIIVGDVTCDKRIVMGDSGRIEGTVSAVDIIVKGSIKGDVTARNILHLQSSSFIEGTITAKSMVVDEGASYNGECRVGTKANKMVKQKVA